MKHGKVLIVAGDPSGDLHASRLISEIRARAPEVEILAAGGPRMRAAGATMVASLEGLGVMGFAEVFAKVPKFISLMRNLKKVLQRTRPQLVIAVDYPGFNLRLCAYAKSLGTRVMYYIAPQVWAWGKGRLGLMSSVIDKLVVVFPFEADFFKAQGIDAEFVGHPLLESTVVHGDRVDVRKRLGIDSHLPVLALLPGSRRQEVRRLLPEMLEVARLLRKESKVEIAIGAADTVPEGDVTTIVSKAKVPARILRGVTSELLYASSAALVASGSATLEAAIQGTPMVIVYKVSPLSWAIARRVVSIDTIGLVNIVAGRKIVPEHLQGDIDAVKISEELGELIFDQGKRARLSVELQKVRESLGEPGASGRAAEIALNLLKV